MCTSVRICPCMIACKHVLTCVRARFVVWNAYVHGIGVYFQMRLGECVCVCEALCGYLRLSLY